MKTLLYIGLLVFSLASCQQKAQEASSEETQEESIDGFYGEQISEKEAISADVFFAKLASADSLQTTLEASITATCAMKGCWMTVDVDGKPMRVTFKDYGFFVPKEGMEGKKVIFEGVAKRQVTSMENLRHYAQDAGKSKEEIEAITEAKEELSFVASGVIIKDI